MDFRNQIFNINTLFYTQLVLISNTLLGSCIINEGMVPYLMYNLVFLFVFGSGIMFQDKHEPVEMAMIINIISGIFDFVLLIFYPPPQVWSKLTGIFNLFTRIISHFVLRSEVKSRKDGSADELIGGGPYQNIDDGLPNI